MLRDPEEKWYSLLRPLRAVAVNSAVIAPADTPKKWGDFHRITNVNTDDATKTYDLFITDVKFYKRSGLTTVPEIDLALDALLKTNQLKPPLPAAARFFDNTYVQQANAQWRGR